MRKLIYLLFLIFVGMVSFNTIEPLFMIPKGWQKPTYDFTKNKLTQDKIIIGRALFYDNILSIDSTTSCASCHLSYTAFAHTDHALSHGIHNKIGIRNAPALFNLAWSKKLMWDGAINHLDAQALAPIHNKDEMDETINHVVEKLNASVLYKKLFYVAYNDSMITGEKTLKCIAQFLLTIQSYHSKYDSVINHQSFFTNQEKNGYHVFQKNCASCHAEPLFTNNEFATNGLKMDTTLNDFGRIKITHNLNDSLVFKIPSLRNIEFTYPYMHDGRFKKLSEVLNHYTSSVQPYKNLPGQLKKSIVLSSNEKVDLIAFLLTLTDRHFLYNGAYQFPKNSLMPTKDKQ
jgi:cytochrome c peroxidase